MLINMLDNMERKRAIWLALLSRRYCTAKDLAMEFHVCVRTIRNDLCYLTLYYPIESVSGRNGGFRIADWYHPHRKHLSLEQFYVLSKCADIAPKYDRMVLRSIIDQFASL